MAGIDTRPTAAVLKDSYLLERIGFTAEKVESRLRNDRTVIDPESLLNHLDRFRNRIWKPLSPTLGGDPPQALVAGRGVCRGWTRHPDPLRAGL